MVKNIFFNNNDTMYTYVNKITTPLTSKKIDLQSSKTNYESKTK